MENRTELKEKRNNYLWIVFMTVIVIDTGNYKASYSEKIPFKAIVKDIYDNEIWAESIVTGKLYELYYNQILESMNIEEIKSLLNLDNYGR